MTTLIDQQIQALLDQYRSNSEANLALLEEALKALADADRANEFMVRRIAAALHQHALATRGQSPAPQVRPAGAPPHPQHQAPWRPQ